MLHLFYSMDAKAADSPAVCVSDAVVMGGASDEAQMARIKAMRVHCVENATLTPGQTRYPVAMSVTGRVNCCAARPFPSWRS